MNRLTYVDADTDNVAVFFAGIRVGNLHLVEGLDDRLWYYYPKGGVRTGLGGRGFRTLDTAKMVLETMNSTPGGSKVGVPAPR